MSAFYRKPVIGGDENQWGPFNDAHILNGIGLNSCKLYDDAGTLKISKGRIGIDNGSVEGCTNIDTVTSISLAAVTNSNWAKIEMSVSGTVVTFAASDINTGVDIAPEIIPDTFKNAFDESKQGYYITATKRVVGLAWVNSNGNLAGVINANNYETYTGYSTPEAKDKDNVAIDCKITFISTKDAYKASGICEIGDWDMDATTEIKVILGISTFRNIRNVSVMIRADNNNDYSFLTQTRCTSLGAVEESGGVLFSTAFALNEISLRRVAGGYFDNVSYDDGTDFNRGWIYLEFEE